MRCIGRLIGTLSIAGLVLVAGAVPASADPGIVPPPVDVEAGPLTPAVTEPAAPAASQEALTALARAAVAARNAYLVTGAALVLAPPLAAWFAAERPTLDERRAALAATSVEYASHEEAFGPATLTADATTATLVATVESRLGMRGTGGNTGVPPLSAGAEELHFAFGAHAGVWVLERVDTDDVGGAYYESYGVPDTASTLTHAPPAEPVADADGTTVAEADPLLATGGNALAIATPPPDDSNRRRADRRKVVAYAVAHSGVNGHPYNGAFKAFRGDCTNFVSQAVEDGGWAMTSRYNGDPTREWWYHAGNDYASSWVAAQHLYWVIDDNGWAPKRVTLSGFQPGDIMQVRLGNYHPDEIGHSMLVTARDSKGNLYLTYHTANWENTPYADFIRRAKTKVTVYGWNVG